MHIKTNIYISAPPSCYFPKFITIIYCSIYLYLYIYRLSHSVFLSDYWLFIYTKYWGWALLFMFQELSIGRQYKWKWLRYVWKKGEGWLDTNDQAIEMKIYIYIYIESTDLLRLWFPTTANYFLRIFCFPPLYVWGRKKVFVM